MPRSGVNRVCRRCIGLGCLCCANRPMSIQPLLGGTGQLHVLSRHVDPAAQCILLWPVLFTAATPSATTLGQGEGDASCVSPCCFFFFYPRAPTQGSLFFFFRLFFWLRLVFFILAPEPPAVPPRSCRHSQVGWSISHWRLHGCA